MMKKIELTEKEEYYLRTLLKGGVMISDSISQGHIFEDILYKIDNQSVSQPEDKKESVGTLICTDCKVPTERDANHVEYFDRCPKCGLANNHEYKDETCHILKGKLKTSVLVENNTEEWKKEFNENFSPLFYYYRKDDTFNICTKGVIEFIEQLLSERRNALDEYLANGGDPECTIISTKDYQKSLEERSFSKEELKLIGIVCESQRWCYGNSIVPILQKVDRLLSLNGD